MNTDFYIIVGNASEEIKSIQIIALSLNNTAKKVRQLKQKQIEVSDTLPPLLYAGSKAMSLATIYGAETPIEILALSTRNTFELYTILIHLLLSPRNCQLWKEEAVTDQLQIYNGILTVNAPDNACNEINIEIDRVKNHAKLKNLDISRRIPNFKNLAVEAGLESEYNAFFKLYSKFVHPSSFVVNWPGSASTPIYRSIFNFNIQLYGLLILDKLESEFSIQSVKIYDEARKQFEKAIENFYKNRQSKN